MTDLTALIERVERQASEFRRLAALYRTMNAGANKSLYVESEAVLKDAAAALRAIQESRSHDR